MSAPTRERAGPGTELALATLAFAICFYAWSLLGPLGPDLQDALDLSDLQTSAMVAVPVCWFRSCASRSDGSPTGTAGGACSTR
jgi:nitrate/nitrite transporter NarK